MLPFVTCYLYVLPPWKWAVHAKRRIRCFPDKDGIMAGRERETKIPILVARSCSEQFHESVRKSALIGARAYSSGANQDGRRPGVSSRQCTLRIEYQNASILHLVEHFFHSLDTLS